jgi:hypothetical protein
MAYMIDRATAFGDRFAPRGWLDFRGTIDTSRDGADDFLEPFAHWPFMADLAGDGELAERVQRYFWGIRRQLDQLGYTDDGEDLGTDWFHQGEGNLFAYALTATIPTPDLRAAAVRRADTYAAPGATNYDFSTKTIRAPHPGILGPRWGFRNGDGSIPWDPGMARYGLPVLAGHDLTKYDDLRDHPERSRRLGQVAKDAFGRGDVVVNLAATGAVLDAWLHTGDAVYAGWIREYVDAWMNRAEDNGGIVPDNVGSDGIVGSHLQGKWWGGLYGWHWPHGAHSVLPAVAVASIAAAIVSEDETYLNFIRAQWDLFVSRGRVGRISSSDGALRDEYLNRFERDELDEYALLAPHRYGPNGWFDELPVEPTIPITLWHLTGATQDKQRVEDLRQVASYDWGRVRATRLKEDSGHEEPWYEFLHGRNSQYPDAALHVIKLIVEQRSDSAWDVPADPDDIHLWQRLNPVTTEHLLQLRAGAPSPLYYGGHAWPALRVSVYNDSGEEQPRGHLDVVVTAIERHSVTATLHNAASDSLIVVLTGFNPLGHTAPEPANGDQGERLQLGANETAIVTAPRRRWFAHA